MYGDDQSDFGSFRVDGGTIQFRGKRWGFQLPLPALQQQDWSGNKLSIRLPNQSVSMTFAKADADRIRCIDGARNSGVIPTIFPPLHESNNLLLARERYPWTNLLMAQLLIGNVLRAAVKEGKFNESMAVDVGSVILVGTIIVVITIIDPAPKARKRIANFRKRLTGKLIADKDTGLWQVETSTQSPDSTTLSRESS
ncbi:MAG: hypothetical protein JST40_08110 [Armatimonadetes bacterium]|nr:hypothetical protein [Armatimonadota bacterium]